MILRYASPLHHDDDDPGGLIGEAFAMGNDFPGPAEDLLLSWMLRLPAGADASAAAASLLARYALREGPLPDNPRGRLAALLRETAAAAPAPARPRRRGGRAQRTSCG